MSGHFITFVYGTNDVLFAEVLHSLTGAPAIRQVTGELKPNLKMKLNVRMRYSVHAAALIRSGFLVRI